ncbi:MAG: hypothetical protein JNL58_24485 [Planctomyces sp.]|nr:hypothetical protein [Planctomyces sp.]
MRALCYINCCRHIVSRHYIVCSLTLLSAMSIIAGCGEQRAAPVDVAIAKASLTDVMEHWKGGGSIEDLREREPEIVAQEALWSAGRRLLTYEVKGEGRVEDANWFCEVELTLEAEDGGEPVKKTMTYVIGTDPVLTVFRAIL